MKGLNSQIFLVFLVCFIITHSCNNNQKLSQFNNYKKNIDNSLFKVFPINDENFGSPYIVGAVYPSTIERNYSGIFITYQMNKRDSFENKLAYFLIENNASIKYNSDNKFVIPDSLYTLEKGKEIKNTPIPSLNDFYNYLDNIVNPEESTFILIDSGTGEYFRKPFDLDNKKYHHNGYSIGIIADESNYYITYWLMVW